MLDSDDVRSMVEAKLESRTQREVATNLGISCSYLNDYLHFRRDPGPTLLESLGLRRVAMYEHRLMKIIGYILATIVIMVYAAMMDGLAISKLWSWFIVTTFGLPALTIPEAIGLAMVVIYITTKPDDKNNEDTYFEKLLKGSVIATIKPLFAIGIGAIVKLWI